MFSMLFTAGIGYFIYVNQGVLSSLSVQRARDQAVGLASSEMLTMQVGLSTVNDPWGQTGDLWLRVTNTGTVPATLLYIFVINTTSGKIASKSQVTPGIQFLSLKGTLAQKGDLNISLPLTVLPGVSTNLMTGCQSSPGCDIAISKMAYAYKSGFPVEVSVVTSDGNTFSAPYPAPVYSTTMTTTSAVTTAVTTTMTGGNPGGAVLVVQMVATPPQTFACGHCVNDTVTVYNYGTYSVSGISLSPSVPSTMSTGTLQITSIGPCVLQGGVNSLPAYSGSGPVPHIVYVCTFKANPQGFGGFASFTGSATGTYNGLPTTSGVALSNTIQIGGPVSVLNQGPFSVNFFYFKYSACTNAPSGGRYSPSCTTTPSPVTIGNLPTASVLTGSSSYYVAFYVQITNNFNVTIPILPYTYFLTDPTQGGETSFYIAGNPASLPYVPNYNPGGNGIPTLTPYPSSCVATSTSTCINLAPGASVTLTFAACDITSTWWDWAGSAYGNNFDSGNTCTTHTPSYRANEATWIDIIVSFVYKGQVYDQGIPFAGMKVN